MRHFRLKTIVVRLLFHHGAQGSTQWAIREEAFKLTSERPSSPGIHTAFRELREHGLVRKRTPTEEQKGPIRYHYCLTYAGIELAMAHRAQAMTIFDLMKKETSQ